jgi:hypothetical protein
LEKEEIKKEREKKRKRLTLTGLLMEGTINLECGGLLPPCDSVGAQTP